MISLQNAAIIFIKKISKYSTAYYLIIIILLNLPHLDIFKDNVSIDYIINGVIFLASFTFTTNIIDKILKKTQKDGRPYLPCPECQDAKMRTNGEFSCENCGKIFGERKKE